MQQVLDQRIETRFAEQVRADTLPETRNRLLNIAAKVRGDELVALRERAGLTLVKSDDPRIVELTSYQIPQRKFAELADNAERMREAASVAGMTRLGTFFYPAPSLSEIEDVMAAHGTPHTLDRHGGVSVKDLDTRLKAEPGLDIASSFHDAATAQAAVDFTFFTNRNQFRLRNFLRERTNLNRFVLYSEPYPKSLGIGRVRNAGAEDGFRTIPDLRLVKVVIERKSGTDDMPYSILTAHPIEHIAESERDLGLIPVKHGASVIRKEINPANPREIVERYLQQRQAD